MPGWHICRSSALTSWSFPVTSSITDPIPELLEQYGFRDRPGGHNSRLMLNYGGITQDGRVYVGRGGGTIAYDAHIGPAFDFSAKRAAEVEEDFRFLYPELRDVPIARAWAGPIDRSTTGLPWFGRLEQDERIHYAIGYTGHGVGASALGGRILASALLDRRDEWTALADCFMRARTRPLSAGTTAIRRGPRCARRCRSQGTRRARGPRALGNRQIVGEACASNNFRLPQAPMRSPQILVRT